MEMKKTKQLLLLMFFFISFSLPFFARETSKPVTNVKKEISKKAEAINFVCPVSGAGTNTSITKMIDNKVYASFAIAAFISLKRTQGYTHKTFPKMEKNSLYIN